jgi:outer membrane protein assembly factor BamB
MGGSMRRAARATGVGAVALALAGCWYAPGQGPNRTGHNPFESEITPETVVDLTEQWTAATDDGGLGPPVVSNVAVHVAAGQSYYGFDVATGARLWKHTRPNPGIPVSLGQPVADGDRLLVGSGIPNLGGSYTTEWLDGATGDALGISTGAGLADSLRGSMVALRFIGFGSGTPVATLLAVHDFDDPSAGWSGLVHFASGTAGPPVTLGSAAVYQAGQGITSVADPANPTFGSGVRAYPLTQPDRCGPSNSFVCPEWATPLDGGGTVPVLGDGETVLYTGTSAGTVYAVDTATGAILWSAALGSGVTATPALADGVLYVPTGDGRLVALDAAGCGAATCGALWEATASPGSAIVRQPAVAGGVVFTGWGDGSLQAFPAAGCGSATCTPIWSASTGGVISGAPAVTGGRLYVGTQDGRLIAYGLD